jgi:hypothetical protein
MKKLLVIALMGLLYTGQAQNNSISGSDSDKPSPPAVVTNRFTIDNPNVIANWTLDDKKNYRATYTDKLTGKGKVTIYNAEGKPIGYESEIGKGDYPSGIYDYCVTNYPNEKCKIWSTEDTLGNKTYYTTRTTETVWFDKDGKLKLKEKFK